MKEKSLFPKISLHFPLSAIVRTQRRAQDQRLTEKCWAVLELCAPVAQFVVSIPHPICLMSCRVGFYFCLYSQILTFIALISCLPNRLFFHVDHNNMKMSAQCSPYQCRDAQRCINFYSPHIPLFFDKGLITDHWSLIAIRVTNHFRCLLATINPSEGRVRSSECKGFVESPLPFCDLLHGLCRPWAHRIGVKSFNDCDCH